MKRARKSVLAIPIIALLLLALAQLPGVPRTAAFTVPNQATAGNNSLISIGIVLKINNPGDLIVLNIQGNDGTSGDYVLSVFSVTDNQSNDYSLGAENSMTTGETCGATNCFVSAVYYTEAALSGHDQISVQFSQAATNSNLEGLDVASPGGFQSEGETQGSFSYSESFQTPSLEYDSTDFADASIFTGCSAASTFSSSSGYNAVIGPVPYAGDAIFQNPLPGVQPANPTNFHAGCSSETSWDEAAALIGVRNLVTIATVDVVPCTAYQLQCWLYPFFVFGIYMVLIVGAARMIKVPKQDYVGHMLEGLTIASLLCVVFGILNVMPALIFSVIQVVRVVRL